ncbi:MAG: hypothetical protein KC636_16535 [Myxococcales bacterium]|nr:hypothetical protein [Myxococcales bacterium]
MPRRPPARPRARPRDHAPEVRVCGVNACLAVAARRPEDVRRVYLDEERLPSFGVFLRECARRRVAYHVVDHDELARVTGSVHHEGVCFLVRERPPPPLRALLEGLAGAATARLLYLDGVQNPHNLGAVLRVAAHFGVAGVLARGEGLGLSTALLRTAEGGAEWVPLVPVPSGDAPLVRAREAGFTLVATGPRARVELYTATLPARVVLLLGAEATGLSREAYELADARVRIPGTGQVESLNVACAAAVALGEHWRQHTGPRPS